MSVLVNKWYIPFIIGGGLCLGACSQQNKQITTNTSTTKLSTVISESKGSEEKNESTSQTASTIKESATLTIQDQQNTVKSQLVGMTFTVYPQLYDGMDVNQAMDTNQAPQNLVHDNVKDITFTGETSARIGLLGNYRPNHDATYEVTKDTIKVDDLSIPYEVIDGVLMFKTWTTDSEGHTITWAIRE